MQLQVDDVLKHVSWTLMDRVREAYEVCRAAVSALPALLRLEWNLVDSLCPTCRRFLMRQAR